VKTRQILSNIYKNPLRDKEIIMLCRKINRRHWYLTDCHKYVRLKLSVEHGWCTKLIKQICKP